MGQSRGGTRRRDARVDAKGGPVCRLISPGNDHDMVYAETLLEGVDSGTIVVTDKVYDADSVCFCIRPDGAIPKIPNRSNRTRKSAARGFAAQHFPRALPRASDALLVQTGRHRLDRRMSI